ncbi:SRPBCC family protein [Herbiconiux solani]|uniref:SRPBCC family protein n=1 Tax=Herbiconiux solani TaxID=661329 RepID=UPI0008248846|nr:SRPBCC domain-containing protein [Herbiconiux solani]
MTGSSSITRLPQGLEISRRFAASRERIFRALSEADQLMQWWGPASCPVVECSVDFRPGGIWHYRLHLPDGGEAWTRAVYREISAPERITYREHSSDAAGTETPDRPAALGTITLRADDDGTLFTVTLRYESPLELDRAIRTGVERGFPAALDQLAALLDRPGLVYGSDPLDGPTLPTEPARPLDRPGLREPDAASVSSPKGTP